MTWREERHPAPAWGGGGPAYFCPWAYCLSLPGWLLLIPAELDEVVPGLSEVPSEIVVAAGHTVAAAGAGHEVIVGGGLDDVAAVSVLDGVFDDVCHEASSCLVCLGLDPLARQRGERLALLLYFTIIF